jgi:hypothetical protein
MSKLTSPAYIQQCHIWYYSVHPTNFANSLLNAQGVVILPTCARQHDNSDLCHYINSLFICPHHFRGRSIIQCTFGSTTLECSYWPFQCRKHIHPDSSPSQPNKYDLTGTALYSLLSVELGAEHDPTHPPPPVSALFAPAFSNSNSRSVAFFSALVGVADSK